MTKLRVNQFYCVSTRKRMVVDKEDIKVKMIRSPKRKTGKAYVLVADSDKCDHKMYKFISDKKGKELKKKGGL